MRSQGEQATPRTAVLRGLTTLAAMVALGSAGRAQEAPPGDQAPFLLRFGGPQPTTFSVLMVGAGLAPGTGSWAAFGLLCGGESPEFNKVWSLQGPLSTPRGRRLVGGGTLFLSGFTGPCGYAPAAELLLLQAGEQAGCWEL